eukprot:899340-Amphidinium_carterae.2
MNMCHEGRKLGEKIGIYNGVHIEFELATWERAALTQVSSLRHQGQGACAMELSVQGKSESQGRKKCGTRAGNSSGKPKAMRVGSIDQVAETLTVSVFELPDEIWIKTVSDASNTISTIKQKAMLMAEGILSNP